MRRELRDTATLKTGLFAKPEAKGDLVYLQVKHFDENGLLKTEIYPDLMEDKVTEKHLLSDGDILFAAKGTKNFATVYENHNPPAVASTSFFVIRVKEKGLLPQFLAWYLNQPSTLKKLKEQATGTAILSISKAMLEDLEIPEPEKRIQYVILQISALMRRENEIQNRLSELRETKIQKQIFERIK
ncbi:MAG: restriction endonuclease subunit S [Chitinophagaceae bacterium]